MRLCDVLMDDEEKRRRGRKRDARKSSRCVSLN